MAYACYYEPTRKDGKCRRLLLYLHGLGEIGGEFPDQVIRHGPWLEGTDVRNQHVQADLDDFLRVGPHLKSGDWDACRLVETLDQVKREHAGHIREDCLYVAGISLGGKAALELAATIEAPVTAVAAFCPVSVDRLSDALVKAPIYLFHAADDDIVPLTETRRRVYDELSSNPRFRWREMSKAETMEWGGAHHPHVCWTHVFDHPDLYEWFRSVDHPSWPAFRRIPWIDDVGT